MERLNQLRQELAPYELWLATDGRFLHVLPAAKLLPPDVVLVIQHGREEIIAGLVEEAGPQPAACARCGGKAFEAVWAVGTGPTSWCCQICGRDSARQGDDDDEARA